MRSRSGMPECVLQQATRISRASRTCSGWPKVSAATRGRGRLTLQLADDAAGPRRHHDHAVAEEHRLVDRVGDQHHGLAGWRARCAAARRSSSRGSARRARRTARPSAGASDRATARGRWRRAAACRRTARTDTCSRSPAIRRCEAGRAPAVSRPPMLCPPTRSGSVTFCQTVSHGSSVACWNTTPTSAVGPSMVVPASENVPASARSRPASRRSSVLLPQPDGPTRQTNSPSSTAMSRWSSASTGSPETVGIDFDDAVRLDQRAGAGDCAGHRRTGLHGHRRRYGHRGAVPAGSCASVVILSGFLARVRPRSRWIRSPARRAQSALPPREPARASGRGIRPSTSGSPAPRG